MKKEKSPFAKIDHIAIIIKDMNQATEYYESLGLGPFEPVTVALSGRTVRGKAVDDVKNKASLGKVGQTMIELVEPVAGEANIYKEYLERQGESIHHVAFTVDDIERETAKLVEQGVKILSAGTFVNGGGYTYFDTAKTGGVVLELTQWPPE